MPSIPPLPGEPADAYPPQMGPAKPSEEERERQRERDKEYEQQRNNRPAPQDNCKNGQCKPFAKTQLERRLKNFECCTVIRYLTLMDLSYGPRAGTIETDVGIFGPAVISTNGDHVGVICGKGFTPSSLSDVLYKETKVYDNNIPTGTTGNFWVDGAYYVLGRSGLETFLQAHMHGIGRIRVGGEVPN